MERMSRLNTLAAAAAAAVAVVMSLMVKNFKNRLIFGKGVGKSRVSCFLTHRVVLVKVKVHTLDIAPLRMNHHRRSAQVWHVFSRNFTVLPAHPHVHPQSE